MFTPPSACSLYFPLSTTIILNGSTSYRSFKYANFNTKLGWHSATDWWYSIFPKLKPAPVSAKPDIYDDFGPYPVREFRRGNCLYIWTTAFDMRRYDSNTGIFSLCRYKMQLNCRYYSWILNLVIALNRSSWYLKTFNWIGNFYFILITSLAVFSIIFSTYSTRADLEADGSSISHIRNSWSKGPNHSSLHDWDIWALCYTKMKRIVVDDVWYLPYWIPWETPVLFHCWIPLGVLLNWQFCTLCNVLVHLIG